MIQAFRASVVSPAAAIALVVGLACPAAFAEAAAPEAVEYKFSLSPRVADGAVRDKLWRAVGGGDHVSQKKCRLIRFLETENNDLDAAGYIVRHRVKLKEDACPDALPEADEGELTVKFRHADGERALREAEKPWGSVGDHKLEADVTVARGKAGQVALTRAYSLSATIEDAPVPDTVRRVRDYFPEALGSLRSGSRLAAGCRRVLEERWELKTDESANLPAEVELALWYRVSRAGKKELEPVLAELSFKASLADATGADALAARLMRELDPDLLAEGGSKTSAILKCGRR